MKMMRSPSLCFAFLCVLSRLTNARAPGVDCFSCLMDTGSSSRNCECDRLCAVYGDCCHDAATVDSTRRFMSLALSNCVPFGEPSRHQGAYMISTCSRNYQGPSFLQSKCRDQDDGSDPVLSTPVTNTRSGVTYRSRFCAECNNAPPAALRAWRPFLECDSLGDLHLNDSFVRRRLHYRNADNRWGVQFRGQFHGCGLVYDMPSTLSRRVRLCRVGLVDTCLEDWRHLPSKRKCETSYMGVVYTTTRAYRNVHCAFCNGEDLDKLKCNRDSFLSRRSGGMSFAMLMDMNFTDGDEVGRTRRCPKDMVFDPFYRKCRYILCALPGFSVVNGKCQKHRLFN